MTTLKPKKEYSIRSDILSVFNHAVAITTTSDKQPIGRIMSLRPSQLPFCPVGFFCHHAHYGQYRMLDFMGGFYTSVGTAVHEVMQDYLGQSGRFLSDWECTICKKWRRMSTNNECCDFPMRYHEVEINYKGVVGHIDGIFKDKDGRYWIVDFKTISLKNVENRVKDPGQVYIEQIEAYALFLRLQYGIVVAGVMLFFVPRDNPKEPKVYVKELSNADFKRIMTKFKVYRKMHREALAVSTMKEALNLARYGKCVHPRCGYCTKGNAKSHLRLAFETAKAADRLPMSSLASK